MELAFGLLGPLDVRQDGQPITVPVGNQRRVLTLLLLDGGAVARTRIMTELWGRVPPKSAGANLRTYLSGLRSWLADRADLVHHGSGWRLAPAAGVRFTVDLTAFEAALARGRRAAGVGELAVARRELRSAVECWRGAPLQDVPQGSVLTARAAMLTAKRLAATEEYADVLLELGEYELTRVTLHAFLGDHSHRERAWAQLMMACYRGGDLAGALDAYRSARSALIARYGVEPGAELASLHRAMLRRALPADPSWVRAADGRWVRHRPDQPPYRTSPRPPIRVVRRREVAAASADRG